jgi:CHAD domain-containing protein
MGTKIDDAIRLRAEQQLQKYFKKHDLIQNPDSKAVHQLRVYTKKLRAYLSLYPEAVHPQSKAVQAKLKQIADLYAGSRDSVVLLKTLRQQTKQLKSAKRERLESWLLIRSAGGPEDTGHPDGREVRELLCRCLEEWPTDLPADWNPVDGIQALFARAKKVGKQALRKDDDVLFHRWRKWVKHLYYSLSLLDSGQQRKASRKQLKILGDKLGQYHDLVVLEAALSTEPPQEEELKVLVNQALALIGKHKASYKKQFSRYYTRLYSDPRLFDSLD